MYLQQSIKPFLSSQLFSNTALDSIQQQKTSTTEHTAAVCACGAAVVAPRNLRWLLNVRYSQITPQRHTTQTAFGDSLPSSLNNRSSYPSFENQTHAGGEYSMRSSRYSLIHTG